MLTDWLTHVLFKKDKNNWPGIVAVFLVLISPILLLEILTYKQVHEDLSNISLSRRQAIAYLAAATLKEKLGRLEDLGFYLTTRVRFRRLVQAGDWKEAVEFLRSEPKDFQFVDRIFLTDPDGALMTDTPRLPGVRGKIFADQDWYKGVSRRWQPYISNAYPRSQKPQDNVVAAAIPIRGDKKEIIGILVLQVKLVTFFQWSQAIDVGPTGAVHFVDRIGQLVAHPKFLSQDEIVDYSNAPSVQKVLRGEHGTEVFFDPFEKREFLVAYEPIAQYGWGALAMEPMETAFAARSSTLQGLLFVYVMILLLGSSLTVLILRTLAERRKNEETLRKSEEHSRSILETARDAFVSVDQQETIIDWNHQAEVTFGWLRSEAIGQKLVETIIPLEYREAHRKGLERFLTTGEGPILNKPIELTALHRDGHSFPVEIVVWPLRSEQTFTFNAFCRDITERKRADETRSRLAAIVESSEDAIIGNTLEGTIMSWNRGAERIYGYSADEVLGRSILILAPPDRPEEMPRMLERLKRGERIENHRTERLRKDSRQIHVSLTVSPIRDAEGRVIGASSIARDVTERIMAERAIEKLHEDLKQRAVALEAANKELESFSYSVSHDLRAPLRSINGFSQALLEDYADQLDDQGKNYLQRVCVASQHMGDLIDDLLSLSRVTRKEMRCESVDLSALGQVIAAELKRSQPQRTVEFIIHPGLMVEGDAGLLRVALQNLLGNAWKFTAKQSQAKIEFGLVNDNGQASYFVRDNGAGFDMTHADKLFGAFQRLHSISEFEGTGIGLATVQRIVHRHGGRVWAEASLNQGATFYFTLS